MQNREVEAIREMVLEMQSRAKEMLQLTAANFWGPQSPEALDTIEKSDQHLDKAEREVDDLVLRCLALRRPVSRDLRFMVVSTRIASHWERVGDEVTSIARHMRHLKSPITGIRAEALRKIFSLVLSALEQVRPLLASDEYGEALQLVSQDKEIDVLNKKIFTEETSAICDEPTMASDHVRVLLISRALERIGDHVKHIAQDIHFMHHEEDIRHTAPNANEPQNTTAFDFPEV